MSSIPPVRRDIHVCEDICKCVDRQGAVLRCTNLDNAFYRPGVFARRPVITRHRITRALPWNKRRNWADKCLLYEYQAMVLRDRKIKRPMRRMEICEKCPRRIVNAADGSRVVGPEHFLYACNGGPLSVYVFANAWGFVPIPKNCSRYMEYVVLSQ